jgi:hypothetical protein
MAEHPSPDGAPVHPDVRYEHSDVDTRRVFYVGLALAGSVALFMALLVGLYWLLLRAQQPTKGDDLPAAASDEQDRLPPEPRLEGIDDLRDQRFRPWPPRAAEQLGPAEKRLQEGGKGELPIAEAIKDLAGKMPATSDEAPPAGARLRLPSKASSGRTFSGGQ